jgi:serine/threonine protein kinase
MELSHEIEILKKVQHPNIIQFHDCWFQNSEFVFITELMTSGTLREYSPLTQIYPKTGDTQFENSQALVSADSQGTFLFALT